MNNKMKTKAVCLEYRIESDYPMVGPLLPKAKNVNVLMENRSLAIVAAAKSQTVPFGQEIRVVYLPTGEVVYRKEMTTCLEMELEGA